jgi:hypothetical protein
VPPCFDVSVSVRTGDHPALLARFIDKYVDTGQPGDPRFDAFIRTFVSRMPAPGDGTVLAELRRDESAHGALSLYLRAKAHRGAIITITEEGDLVLGLGLDDPCNAPETVRQAADLITSLRIEYGARAGIAGVALPPPQSESEWDDHGLVQLREGHL